MVAIKLADYNSPGIGTCDDLRNWGDLLWYRL